MASAVPWNCVRSSPLFVPSVRAAGARARRLRQASAAHQVARPTALRCLRAGTQRCQSVTDPGPVEAWGIEDCVCDSRAKRDRVVQGVARDAAPCAACRTGRRVL